MSRDENLSWFHGKVSREYAEDLIKKGMLLLKILYRYFNNFANCKFQKAMRMELF